MNATIGVVVATYNGEKYIEEQLLSIIKQTLKPDLIVISDGNSSDDTVKVCKKVQEKSGIDFKLLTSDKQLSVPVNFNKALENCDCDFIFFSDQDDYWVEDKIEITIGFIQRTNSCMAFSNAILTNQYLEKSEIQLWNSIGFNQKEEITVYKKGDRIFINELIKHNVVTGMTTCITAALRKYILPLSESAIHDKWISLLAIYYGNVVAINKDLVLYRQHSNNAVGTERSIKKSLKNRKHYIDKLKNRRCMIEELKNRIDTREPLEESDLTQYLSFLNRRIEFVHKEERFFFIIYFAKDYFRYEYRPMEILIKDLIVRINK